MEIIKNKMKNYICNINEFTLHTDVDYYIFLGIHAERINNIF